MFSLSAPTVDRTITDLLDDAIFTQTRAAIEFWLRAETLLNPPAAGGADRAIQGEPARSGPDPTALRKLRATPPALTTRSTRSSTPARKRDSRPASRSSSSSSSR